MGKKDPPPHKEKKDPPPTYLMFSLILKGGGEAERAYYSPTPVPMLYNAVAFLDPIRNQKFYSA